MGVVFRQKVVGKGKPWWVFVYHNGRRTSRMVGINRPPRLLQERLRQSWHWVNLKGGVRAEIA